MSDVPLIYQFKRKLLFMIDFRNEFGVEDLRTMCDKSHSNVYGFIMYTRAHPYISKVLRDDDFWNALDEISGENWPIFAIRPLAKGNYEFPHFPPGMVGFMVPEWKEPNENKKYLDFFSLKNSEQLPCFIAFKFNDDETIEQVVYKLNNDSEREAFASLKAIVELITHTENQILPEYKHTDAVFNNVKKDVESYVLRKGLVEGAGKILRMKEAFSSLLNVQK